MYHLLEDRRIKCHSIMTAMSVRDYLQIVIQAYKAKGGIEGQRSPLKTKTAINIRKRMIDDIVHGAIMPPVVLGIVLPSVDLNKALSFNSSNDLIPFLRSYDPDEISLIDGMQRTTALIDSVLQSDDVLNHVIRVEIWIADNVSSLIYRMLVLNTGQIPWEISRQLETVYSQFSKQMKRDLGDGIELFQKEDNRRRVAPGQYQSANIIELLLIFSARKAEIDLKDKVAEDFARLDAIESTAHQEFMQFFMQTLKLMVKLDRSFSRLGVGDRPKSARFQTGRDIFLSFPAMVGFCLSISLILFDESGFDIDWPSAPAKMKNISESVNVITARLDKLNDDELDQFMLLPSLESRLSQRSGQVGRFERAFFQRAFTLMINKASILKDFEPCWRA